jgi:hypothetical protein
MIEIKPTVKEPFNCPTCNNVLINTEDLIYQGVHICVNAKCINCKEEFLSNLPIGQGKLELFTLRKSDKKLFGNNKSKWLVDSFTNIVNNPIPTPIKFEIDIREKDKKEAIILNTIDNCYGHSLLFFLNLQNIIKNRGDKGVIVIIQPFLKWLLPTEGVTEVWTAHLSFNQVREYHSDLTRNINEQTGRFDKVYLSHAPLCPKDVDIEKFSKIKPYGFEEKHTDKEKPRVTFIWREDINRFWFKSYWFYGGLRKLGIAKVILPFHYMRILIFLYLLNYRLKNENYQISLAGLGQFGWFPSFVDDQRVEKFNKETEIATTKIYAESTLVLGVHGSSMILPSAHAGMTVSIMPIKRWGNFIEDLLFNETDVRLASFQRRVIPMNTTIMETADICVNMITARGYFIKKFLYDSTIL